MRNIQIIFLLLFLTFLNNCNSVREVMSGEQRTTDEFLVKKKDPLVLPPKYGELPLPKSKGEVSKDSSIKKMLGTSSEKIGNSNYTSNLENMILNLDRQFLHAKTLGFIHPKSEKELEFNSILPKELEKILKTLRKLSK